MTIAVPVPKERTTAERYAQLQRALDQMGNTHTFDDILALIDSGMMQSFSIGHTWAITQVLDFPQKRVCEIFLLVGDLADIDELLGQIEAYAKDQGCNLLRGYGRPGWAHYGRPRGWTDDAHIFLKELV